MEAKIAELQKTVETQNASLEDHKKTVAEQQKTIETLSEKVESLMKVAGVKKEAEKKVIEKPKLPKDPVTVGKSKWNFRLPAFVFNGTRYTAEEASTSQKLMDEIINTKGQGIMIEFH